MPWARGVSRASVAKLERESVVMAAVRRRTLVFIFIFLLLKQRLIAVLMEVLPRPIKNPANNFLPPQLPVVASEAMVEIQPCWRSDFGRGESDFLTQFGSGGGWSRKRCELDNIDCGVLLVAG